MHDIRVPLEYSSSVHPVQYCTLAFGVRLCGSTSYNITLLQNFNNYSTYVHVHDIHGSAKRNRKKQRQTTDWFALATVSQPPHRFGTNGKKQAIHFTGGLISATRPRGTRNQQHATRVSWLFDSALPLESTSISCIPHQAQLILLLEWCVLLVLY